MGEMMVIDKQHEARRLHRKGASFTAIGKALGLTRQRAEQLVKRDVSENPQNRGAKPGARTRRELECRKCGEAIPAKLSGRLYLCKTCATTLTLAYQVRKLPDEEIMKRAQSHSRALGVLYAELARRKRGEANGYSKTEP